MYRVECYHCGHLALRRSLSQAAKFAQKHECQHPWVSNIPGNFTFYFVNAEGIETTIPEYRYSYKPDVPYDTAFLAIKNHERMVEEREERLKAQGHDRTSNFRYALSYRNVTFEDPLATKIRDYQASATREWKDLFIIW